MRRQILHSVLIASAMIAGSAIAAAWKPTITQTGPDDFKLAQQFPEQFGDWRVDATPQVVIVNPEMQKAIDLLYDQTLDRVYVGRNGERIMLSVAYGHDQSEAKALHKPEGCYPAQGFQVRSLERGAVPVGASSVPVVRMETDKGPRYEPLTYWMVVAGKGVNGPVGQKIQQVGAMFRGQLPDGMLVRVSTITRDSQAGFAVQDRFIRELYAALSAAQRSAVFGRGAG
jgi:EpsI family protein